MLDISYETEKTVSREYPDDIRIIKEMGEYDHHYQIEAVFTIQE